MTYTDKQKEHIEHTFDGYCKKVIRNTAYNIYRANKQKLNHEVSFEKIYVEHNQQFSETDTYPILQYHFTVFDYVLSVNDYYLG